MTDKINVQAAILIHQKECLGSIQKTLSNIWEAIRKFSEHQDHLSNEENTGKVDILWKDYEDRIMEEKRRRRYWTRLIIGSLIVFVLSNLGVLFMFFSQLKALLIEHGIH